MLRTAKRLAEQTAKRRGVERLEPSGLTTVPAALTRWGVKKALPSAPKVGLSASGYRRSLLGWIEQHVTGIYAVEFSIHHPAGFAGTADFLGSIDGNSITIADWKTSFNRRSEALLNDYVDQLGAYSLGLKHLTGLQANHGYIVVARRAGPPDIRQLSPLELRGAEARFLDRCATYYAELPLP